MATKEDGSPHPCHTSIVLTLAQVLRMGQSILNQEESETVIRRLASILKEGFEDTLNAETVLSKELIEMHEEEEEDLLFEVALDEETRRTLSHVARKRVLNAWAQREE